MCWKNNFAYLWGFGDHSLFLAEYRGTLKAKDFSLWIQDVVKPGILDFWTHFPRCENKQTRSTRFIFVQFKHMYSYIWKIIMLIKSCELHFDVASDALDDAPPQSIAGVAYAAPSGAAHTTPSSGILAGGVGGIAAHFSKS